MGRSLVGQIVGVFVFLLLFACEPARNVSTEPIGTGASSDPTQSTASSVVPSGWVEYSDEAHEFSIGLPPGWTVLDHVTNATMGAYDSSLTGESVQVLALTGTADVEFLAEASKRNSIDQLDVRGPIRTRFETINGHPVAINSFRTLDEPQGLVDNEQYHYSGATNSLVVLFKGSPPLSVASRRLFQEIAGTINVS